MGCTIEEVLDCLDDNKIEYIFRGEKEEIVRGFSSAFDYKENTVTWIKNIQRYKKMQDMKLDINPTLIVIDNEVDKVSNYQNKIICNNPKYVFYLILKTFFAEEQEPGIGKNSFIGRNVKLSSPIFIGNNCTIEDDVVIGRNTKIYHNVVIRSGTVIGSNCVIKSGTVIGEEGYGYCNSDNGLFHIPHFGHVVIGDNVEIGSNCSIDCGTMNDTIIGSGSKIDNLCHIAHNVQIGKKVMIVAGVVIGGSAHIKDKAYIAPGSIVRNQIEIGKGCIVGLGSVVLKDTQQDKVMAGVPAKILREVGKEDL